MGPRSDNRGYAGQSLEASVDLLGASMGPRSDNRGYGRRLARTDGAVQASMGPRSDNRGYARTGTSPAGHVSLQWVHGRITVVMDAQRSGAWRTVELQWVHGRITVVMAAHARPGPRAARASMGPRSDNRGYAAKGATKLSAWYRLQWVHGRITVVMGYGE